MGNETFSQVVAKLEPVLDRGRNAADGQRKADLQAHLGWGMFLRAPEGTYDAPPEDMYRKAIAVDPANPYAYAMLGHWILWSTRNVPVARDHFAAAVNSGRVTGYVRELQLAALSNTRTPETQSEMVRVANEMRRRQESIESAAKERIWTVVYRSLLTDAYNARQGRLGGELANAVPPEEHLETFRWLFDAEDLGGKREARLAGCVAGVRRSSRRDAGHLDKVGAAAFRQHGEPPQLHASSHQAPQVQAVVPSPWRGRLPPSVGFSGLSHRRQGDTGRL